MYKLDINKKPLLDRMDIISKRGVAGGTVGAGAHGKKTGEKKPLMFRGKGMEFEKFREFTTSDDATTIDWKATLRAKKRLVKVYEEERNKDIIFFFDSSASMCYSSWGKMKAEYAAELIISLSFAVSESGDNMGLAMFSDKIQALIPPAAGRNQYFRIVKTLLKPKYYDGKFDFVKSFNQLMGILKRKALILIISDFIGLKENWESALKAVAGNFELVGLAVRDPVDDYLPDEHAQVVLSDPYSDKQLLLVPRRIKKQYDEYNRKRLNSIKYLFTQMQSDFVVFHTDEPFVQEIRKFFVA